MTPPPLFHVIVLELDDLVAQIRRDRPNLYVGIEGDHHEGLISRFQSGSFGHLPTGRPTLDVTAVHGTTRVMVLGGEPSTERLRMHWNFVARTTDELARAVADWNDGSDRFGPAVGGGRPRIPAPQIAR